MNVYDYSVVLAAVGGQTNKSGLSLELVLSIIAILISIFAAGFEYLWNNRINKANLEADFFKDIYNDFLVKKIPEARNIIHYNNEILDDVDSLVDVLNDMRRASLFFKYKDKSYYKALCIKLQALEDKLVQKSGHMSPDDFASFTMEINQDIEHIYEIIMKKYIGKKIK